MNEWLNSSNIELITAVVGLLSAFITAGIYFINKRRKHKSQKEQSKQETRLMLANLQSVIDLIAIIQESLNSITSNTCARRAIILSAHNGGNSMTAFSPTYGTALYEAVDHLSPIITQWNNQPLGPDYLDIVRRVIANGHIELKTDEIEDDLLRSVYRSNGVVRSDIYAINYDLTRHCFIYLSINYKDDGCLSDADNVIITTSVSRIRRLYEEQNYLNEQLRSQIKSIKGGFHEFASEV